MRSQQPAYPPCSPLLLFSARCSPRYACAVSLPVGRQLALEVIAHVQPSSEVVAMKLVACCDELVAPEAAAAVCRVRISCV